MNLQAIIQHHQTSKCDISIHHYDDKLIFYPILPAIAKDLTIREKSLECSAKTRWVQKVVYNTAPLYAELPVGDKLVGITYQGFLMRLLLKIISMGLIFDLKDYRIANEKANTFPAPRLDLMHGFRFSQQQLLTDALVQNSSGLIGAPTRYGKCLGLNELCMKYDYTVVRAADVQDGDLLMGPDGLPRKVTGCVHGVDPSYRITPNKGTPFTCNEDHILSLKVHTDTGYDTVNISVKDYLASSDEFKQNAYLYYAPLSFNEKALKIPPAEMGTFIAERPDKIVSIPIDYLTCSFAQRAKFLQGFTAASQKYKVDHVLYIRVASETIANDIIRLGHGMGMVCCKELRDDIAEDEAWFVTFSDDVKRTFTVEYIGEQEYAGFELEGPNKLFLMWDHLVTHNTTLMVNTLRAFPDLTTVVVAPGVDLVKQLYADILGPRGLAPGREVKLICGSKGKKPAGPGGITVCSADSLDKIDPGTIDLVLADEPHALVTESRLRMIDAFPKARRLGFGATLKGRFDGRDQLIEGVFGHVLVERTYKEAVKEGAICPLDIIFLKIEIEPRQFRDRNSAYNGILFHSYAAAELANEICKDIIPSDFQTMIFVKNEKQADMLQDVMGRDTTIAMAKKMTNKEREECDRLMKENIIKRCLCTKIYVQGVTFSDVRVLINLEGGGNNTSAIQKPGRLAEIRPNKKSGIVIDLLFIPPGNNWTDYSGEEWLALCRDSKSRKTAYEEKEYNIHIVDNLTQLKEKFNELI